MISHLFYYVYFAHNFIIILIPTLKNIEKHIVLKLILGGQVVVSPLFPSATFLRNNVFYHSSFIEHLGKSKGKSRPHSQPCVK